jgi:TatD DNase family protein
MDIHSHLGFEDYGKDLDEVIKRMKDAEVGTIAVGADFKSSEDAVKVAIENENIWACIGQHPNEKKDEVFDESKYEDLVINPKVVAIGECGLDYFVNSKDKSEGKSISEEEKDRQKKLFIQQIEFAIKHNKPLMLHIRDAHDDAYEILKDYKGKVKGDLHFFTSNLSNAKKFIELGFTISFPGIITYIRDFDKVIKGIPLEMIHAETDAPFASPAPHRGKRNEPAYVIEVVKKIAEIRGEDIEKVTIQLIENFKKLFGI